MVVRRIAALMLKRLVLLLLVLVAVPLAFVIAVNLRDEAIAPEADDFMKAPTARVPKDQNAFYYVAGFEAPAAEDPHKAGQAWVDAVDATQQKLLSGARDAPWPEQPRGLSKIEAYCIPEKTSCIRWLKESTEGRPALADNAAIVARYRRVLSYPAYAEATDPRFYSYPLPRYAAFSNAQRLYLLEAAQRLERGEIDEALVALREEIAFARRMLAGSHSLPHKMLAAAHLQRTAVFAADALATYREQIGPRAAVLEQSLRPLSAEERALAPSLRSELVMAASALEPTRWRREDIGLPVDTMVLRPFYQHRATVNMLYRVTRAWSDVDNAPATELGPAFMRAREAEPEFSVRRAIYNPVGKMLFFNNRPQLTPYFERIHDTDALVRLVALQAEIVAQNVKPDDVAEVSKRRLDPFTGKPFAWDLTTRQLSFEPHNASLREQKIGGVPNRVAITL
jgi:hypothetical protein